MSRWLSLERQLRVHFQGSSNFSTRWYTYVWISWATQSRVEANRGLARAKAHLLTLNLRDHLQQVALKAAEKFHVIWTVLSFLSIDCEFLAALRIRIIIFIAQVFRVVVNGLLYVYIDLWDVQKTAVRRAAFWSTRNVILVVSSLLSKWVPSRNLIRVSLEGLMIDVFNLDNWSFMSLQRSLKFCFLSH